ncbi:MAG: hypothetical protein U0836_06850 [Pirellulales bacterium]
MSQRLFAIAVSMLFLCPFGNAATFVTLNRTPGETAFPLKMEAISADGQVAIGNGWTGAPGLGQRGPVLWRAATGLHILDGDGPFSDNWESPWAEVSAVSTDGSVIAGAGINNDGDYEAFRWTSEAGAIPIGSLSQSRNLLTVWVAAMTDSGSAIGGESESPNGQEAFVWTPANGMRGLGDLPGGEFRSGILGMTPDAKTMVGYATSERGWEAVRWTEETGFVPLGDLPGAGDVGPYGRTASLISNDGKVVVGGFGGQSFRWTAETGMVGLGDLPGGDTFSGVTDMTPNGTTIVGMAEMNRGSESIGDSFIWDAARGMRSLTDVAIRDYGLTQILVEGVGGRVDAVRGVSDDAKVLVGWDWVIDLRDGPSDGDANFDGAVDLSDFGTLKQNFGAGIWRDQGDLDDNDRVDLSDFGILKANFGRGPAAAPEPATVTLATVGALLLLIDGRRCFRRRSSGADLP